MKELIEIKNISAFQIKGKKLLFLKENELIEYHNETFISLFKNKNLKNFFVFDKSRIVLTDSLNKVVDKSKELKNTILNIEGIRVLNVINEEFLIYYFKKT